MSLERNQVASRATPLRAREKTLRQTIQRVAGLLERKAPFRAELAIVLGTGFQPVANAIDRVVEIDYSSLLGFPRPSVAGHEGKLIFARWAGARLLVLSGRAHFYEGYSFEELTFPIRVVAALGIETILLTNASGGIAAKLRPGDFLALTDHINWMGANPLRGLGQMAENLFLDLTEAYDRRLTKMLRQAAKRARVRLLPGIYAAVSGPAFETPAEIRALARMGADTVGMSTVPEVITARQCGLRVAGLSLVANRAAGLGRGPVSHAEVLAQAEARSGAAMRLMEGFILCFREEAERCAKKGLS